MGGGASHSRAKSYLIDVDEAHHQIHGNVEVLIFNEESASAISSWIFAHLHVDNGVISVLQKDTGQVIHTINLKTRPEIKMIEVNYDGHFYIIKIHEAQNGLHIKAPNEHQALLCLKFLRQEVLLASDHSESFGIDIILKQFEDILSTDEVLDVPPETFQSIVTKKSLFNACPKINIVILVVGTRGDVQPFIYLGQGLQKDGHRVRLATHLEYRDDVVTRGGLEFYPLAGDPRKLSEYMVKTQGRLMPDLLNNEERRELPEKMQMLKDITFSTFPACTECDPEDPEKRPFLADAIISNPVSYGHFHCAEALCIPLVNIY